MGCLLNVYDQILHVGLDMSELPATPCTAECSTKSERVRICNDNLKAFNTKPADFLRLFVTVDETWFHYYVRELKQYSQQ